MNAGVSGERLQKLRDLTSSQFSQSSNHRNNIDPYSSTTTGGQNWKGLQGGNQTISQKPDASVGGMNPNMQSVFYRSVTNGFGGSQIADQTTCDTAINFKQNSNGFRLDSQMKTYKLQPIPSPFQQDQSAMSLGDTLRQKRVLKEHIEIERAAAAAQSRHQASIYEQNVRVRPATPKLNLLKMKKQHSDQIQQRRAGAVLNPVGMTPLQTLTNDKQLKRGTILQPLDKLPAMPEKVDLVQLEAKDSQIKVKVQKKRVISKKVSENEEKIHVKVEEVKENEFERDEEFNCDEESDDEEDNQQVGFLTNFQKKFEEIIENEDVSDAIELNEKFMAEHLGVRAEELSTLTKIELKVDTSCHNLQVTGEILSGLESLRMSDSIIKCFRDLGTSFKFVRYLYLARCELKEIQGIQAFVNLEELYISHNEIDDIFDIGFLDHLSVLDLEGNNLSTLDQLYYLKRCKSLENINLSDNPVTKDPLYYRRIQDCVPNLLVLDDQLIIGSKFYDDKGQQILKQSQTPQPPKTELKSISLVQSLIRLRVPQKLIRALADEHLQTIDNDQMESEILLTSIKSQPIERKAQNQVQEQDFVTLGRLETPKKKLRVVRIGRAITPSQVMFKTSSASFYKTSYRKSTSMSNENEAANESKEVKVRMDDPKKGAVVLRIKQSESVNGSMPGEINRLISGASVKYSVLQNREDIRKKLANNSEKINSRVMTHQSSVDDMLQSRQTTSNLQLSSRSTKIQDDTNDSSDTLEGRELPDQITVTADPPSYQRRLKARLPDGNTKSQVQDKIVLKHEAIKFYSSVISREEVN